ncbi:MAG: hypothetical protein JWL85_493, partial [Candidatus Saccharibacteria bacterium]|nr:hypothetical protein [Candidatus Saccharibacteria bacterium]
AFDAATHALSSLARFGQARGRVSPSELFDMVRESAGNTTRVVSAGIVYLATRATEYCGPDHEVSETTSHPDLTVVPGDTRLGSGIIPVKND